MLGQSPPDQEHVEVIDGRMIVVDACSRVRGRGTPNDDRPSLLNPGPVLLTRNMLLELIEGHPLTH